MLAVFEISLAHANRMVRRRPKCPMFPIHVLYIWVLTSLETRSREEDRPGFLKAKS